jgi:XRE family aerobic/anaerobic benzoate catabolism transcriptional regulator
MAESARNEQAKDLSSGMGGRLRQRRTELALTLTETARRAEVSTSYLAAVENGTSTPSLPVLSRIAHALELTIGGLLAGDTASAVELGSLGDELGTHLLSSSTLQLRVAVQRSPASQSGSCPLPVEGTSVFAYVRAGAVDVCVDGDSWRLDEGDSLHANDPTELTWVTAAVGCTVVWATAPTDAGLA